MIMVSCPRYNTRTGHDHGIRADQTDLMSAASDAACVNRKYLCQVSKATACSSLISALGVFISKFANRCRTQYPQSSGQPITWFRDSPDLRYSITSANSGRTLAYGNSVRPAKPVIDALGRELPRREITITSVSLVSQAPDQMFTWDLVTDVALAVGSANEAPGG